MKSKARFIEVEGEGGLYLPEAGWWLDVRRPKACGFVSHAHGDHVGRHERMICSEGTAKLVVARFGVKASRLDVRGFGEEWEEGGFRFCLLPAGHVLGSAQLFVERVADGSSLLYTGDFKTRGDPVAERVEWREADLLVMETTFGKPRYRMPTTEEAQAAIWQFVVETFAEGRTPLLLGYSLGKAQQIHALLEGGMEEGVMLHDSVARMTRVYEEMGYQFPRWERFDETRAVGRVVIFPPTAMRSGVVKSLGKVRTAMVSGWGMDESARYRFGVDDVIPLSDHADYDGLMGYVEKVSPRRVLTVHGATREFAADLRRAGWEAWSIGGEDQVELGVGSGE
ncbi:MAG: MBL fold metallo-hydrolase RNA specificity domain-containing protein [Verrucomicrobiota bacterium]